MGRRPKFYVLEGKRPVPVRGLLEWARRFEQEHKHVARTRIGGIWVSTVFLGLDHNYTDKGPPILFETMAFRGGSGVDQERCSTWEQAEKQHREMVLKVRREIKEKVNE